MNGENAYLFDSNKQGDFAYLAHLDNLWDLTDEITLRFGGTYLTGAKGLHYVDEDKTPIGADTSKIISQVWGLNFHIKWRPLHRGRYR